LPATLRPPSVVTSARFFRHETNLVGVNLLGNRDNLRHVGHFEIEARANGLADQSNIAILNVPAIFPQMNRNAVRAGKLDFRRCPNRVGFGDRAAFGALVARLA